MSQNTNQHNAFRTDNYNISHNYMANKQLSAREFQEAKQNCNKTKAEIGLLQLMKEKQVDTLRKNPSIMDVTLNGKKYLYNMNKPVNASLSKAVFEALHTNTQVNTSSYKRNKYNSQESIQAKKQERKDNRNQLKTFYVSATVDVTRIYKTKNKKKTVTKEEPFNTTVQARSKREAEKLAQAEIDIVYEGDEEDSLIYMSQTAKSEFITISAGPAQSTADMPMRNASYLNYDWIPHDTQHFKNQGFCVVDVFLNVYALLKNIKKYKRMDFEECGIKYDTDKYYTDSELEKISQDMPEYYNDILIFGM